MSNNCCAQQQKINESLLIRSVIFVIAGILMLFPIVEAMAAIVILDYYLINKTKKI